jgi:hypothetical protein
LDSKALNDTAVKIQRTATGRQQWREIGLSADFDR